MAHASETRAKPGPKPGVRQHRRPKGKTYPRPPLDPLDRTYAAEQWDARRVEVWRRWLKRRKSDRDWPPTGAAHDGIEGTALKARFLPPEGYIGDWDAQPEIVRLAEQGLAEVEAFRRTNPAAARSIAGPLDAYCRLLRQVRDHPAQRLGGIPG